jgi:hypothetical protein
MVRHQHAGSCMMASVTSAGPWRPAHLRPLLLCVVLSLQGHPLRETGRTGRRERSC